MYRSFRRPCHRPCYRSLRRPVQGFLLGLAVLPLCAPVWAQPRPSARPEGVERPRPERRFQDRPLPGLEGIQRLNLTPEQRQQLAALRAKNLEDGRLIQDRQALKEATEQLRTLMAGDGSAAEIRRQHQIIQELRQRLAERRLETMLAVREILTPQQRQELESLRRERFRRPTPPPTP